MYDPTFSTKIFVGMHWLHPSMHAYKNFFGSCTTDKVYNYITKVQNIRKATFLNIPRLYNKFSLFSWKKGTKTLHVTNRHD